MIAAVWRWFWGYDGDNHRRYPVIHPAMQLSLAQQQQVLDAMNADHAATMAECDAYDAETARILQAQKDSDAEIERLTAELAAENARWAEYD